MPEIDLSETIPKSATWIKVHYEMTSEKPGAELIARLWSGTLDEAVVIRGGSGDAFVKLNSPQKLSYQRPVTVELKVKITAYKAAVE